MVQGEKAEDQPQQTFNLSSEASQSYSPKRNGSKGSHKHRKSVTFDREPAPATTEAGRKGTTNLGEQWIGF